MRAFVWSGCLLLLGASACTFLDELDRSIEDKAGELTRDVPANAPPSSASPPIAPRAPAPEPPPTTMPTPAPPPRVGIPKVKVGPATVLGGLPAKKASSTIERHINELRFCYEQSTGAAKATVILKFVVSRTGPVQVSWVEQSDTGDAKLDACLAAAVRRWSFPAPSGGGIAVVTFPIELTLK